MTKQKSIPPLIGQLEFKTLDKNPIRKGMIIEKEINNLFFCNKSVTPITKSFLWTIMICNPPMINKIKPFITENS